MKICFVDVWDVGCCHPGVVVSLVSLGVGVWSGRRLIMAAVGQLGWD